jgi:hypothetical protein
MTRAQFTQHEYRKQGQEIYGWDRSIRLGWELHTDIRQL